MSDDENKTRSERWAVPNEYVFQLNEQEFLDWKSKILTSTGLRVYLESDNWSSGDKEELILVYNAWG